MLDRFERFIGTVSEVHRYLHRIMTDEMQRYDLKGAYAVYFVALHQYGKLTATELGSKCERNKADVSRAISVLEERGLVFRHNKLHSGVYRAQISLTTEGFRIAEIMCDRAKAVVEMAGQGLADESRAIFYAAFDTIANNMKIISEGKMV